MSLRPPATTTAAMLPEIERDTLGTVIAVTGKTCRVQLAGGDVLSGIDASGVAVGQTLRLRYAGGTYTVQGGAGGGSSSGGGAFAGGSGGITGAPSPHDLLGVHHNLPTLAANLFLASPVSASGLPAFRAIGPADLPGQFNGFANPSAQIGLTAINGAATTAMRSDAAPSINQSIAPTWSGVHTFNAGATIAAGQYLNFGADVALTRFGANVLTTGADDSVRSPNFVSGIAGWTIDGNGDAEFNNIVVRGELRAFVFKINELAATAGTFGVFYSAATTYADFTTPATTGSSFTFQAKNTDAGAMLLGVNDVCRTKAWNGAGIVDAWFTITARTNNTTYTTYTATLNSGSTSATIREGTAIVDYGPNSGTSGFITLSADGTVGSSPNITLATHAGAPWTTITPQMRIGNLNGYGSYATNVYGVAIGAPAGIWNAWDTTNGIRFMSGSNTIAQWDASGNVTIGRVGAGLANTYISAGEIQFRTNTTSYFKIATDGRVVLSQGSGGGNSINWEKTDTTLISQIYGWTGSALGLDRNWASLIAYGNGGKHSIVELVAYTANNASGFTRLWLDATYARIVADNSFVANAGITTTGLSSSGGVSASGDVTAGGAMYASNWHRSYGDTGWYSETYGGGLYMTDTTWVRTYNNKGIYSGGRIQAAGGISSCYTMTGQVIASATSYGAFLVPAERDVTISQWTMNVYVQTTNNGSNYWQFDLKRLSDGALIDSWNTAGWAANAWGRSARGLSSAITAASHMGVYVDVIKVGAPGAVQCVSMLYMQ